MLEIGDHWNEDTPSLDLLTDAQEGVALTIGNLNWLKAGSHFLDLVLHFIEVHLSPFEFQIVIKAILAFLDVLP
jgi:hypothetical protein